jgi:hypothetical protein
MLGLEPILSAAGVPPVYNGPEGSNVLVDGKPFKFISLHVTCEKVILTYKDGNNNLFQKEYKVNPYA